MSSIKLKEAFEAFAQSNPMGTYNIARRGDDYESSHTQLMWLSWQAALTAPAAEPTDDALHAIDNAHDWQTTAGRMAAYRDVLALRPATSAEPEAMRDAERYRIVRRGQHWSTINGIGDVVRGEALDADADAKLAAMSAQGERDRGRVDCGECPNVTSGCESGKCMKAQGGGNW